MVETLSQLFLNTVRAYPKPDLFLSKAQGSYEPISSDDAAARVRHLALGLHSLGCRPGDKVILLAENSPWWILSDFAIQSLGAATVPIYPTLVSGQIKFIIQNSDATVVLCSSAELWAKIAAVRGEFTNVRQFVVFFDPAPSGALALKDVLARGREADANDPALFEKGALAVKPGDLASIIYTSGTTGIPKGVMLSHANFVSNIKIMAEIVAFEHPDVVLLFLPLSHVLARMTTWSFLYKGCSIAFAESVETVAENLLEIRPHIMVSVPRLFEKLYAKIMDNVLLGSPLKRKIFAWAVRVGTDHGHRSIEKRPIPAGLRFKRRLAHKLVFSKILVKTGGRVRFFVSGGAPLSRDIADFFYAIGLVVLEGYGLTETSPVLAVNTFENVRFGTVGKVAPGVTVRIAEDGEILAKGPNVMSGYYRNEAETREVFDAEGWFHTGDIGHLDADGFLVITDRKKDLIVTAGGKNVAPQMIENQLRQIPFIANALVVGSRRKFISALIVPNVEKLEDYARQKQIAFARTVDLVARDDIQAFYLDEIDRNTPNLAPYEKIKKIILMDRDFELEREELTPTLKIKRSRVEDKFKDLIDSLYKE
jgi:long-chain acyl-CoA synthetase